MPAAADYVQMLALDMEQLAAKAHQLAQALRVAEWQPQELEDGTDTGRVDKDGSVLHAGDRVVVTGSDRYGEAEAIVRGAGPDLGDGKQRVHVALADGQDDLYTPSVGRVRVIFA